MKEWYIDDIGNRLAGLRLNHSFDRARGWLWRQPTPETQALLFPGTAAIHMWGMRFPLIVLFLDRHGGVMRREHKAPNSRPLCQPGAAMALEVPEAICTAAWRPGRIQWQPR